MLVSIISLVCWFQHMYVFVYYICMFPAIYCRLVKCRINKFFFNLFSFAFNSFFCTSAHKLCLLFFLFFFLCFVCGLFCCFCIFFLIVLRPIRVSSSFVASFALRCSTATATAAHNPSFVFHLCMYVCVYVCMFAFAYFYTHKFNIFLFGPVLEFPFYSYIVYSDFFPQFFFYSIMTVYLFVRE